MAKVKISKRSTRIDMTAMCDVAFLLLSFFIMTATARQPEPHPVDTPESTVQTKLPEKNLATITVGDGEVFFGVMDKDVRRRALERMSQKYNVNFSEKEYQEFSNINEFGVPIQSLKQILGLPSAQRDAKDFQKGIPYDSVHNQLGDWVKFARQAHREILDEKRAAGQSVEQYKDLDIAIKGDSEEDYPTIKRVIAILQDQEKNKFYLVTGLRNKDF